MIEGGKVIAQAFQSTVLAGIVFGLVPIIWWAIKGRKKDKFMKYFGLIRPKSDGWGAVIAIAGYCMIWAAAHLPVFTQYTQPSSGIYLGLGARAIIPAFIISFLQTGFWE
ncbi:MAG: hypothetical protein Q4G07_02725 [Oscillospiraceae bacterium]|nr:hypothetical protein [Oscillospiraceae bacterium]